MDMQAYVTHPCPHFGSCGGCALQHLAPSDYQAFKKEQIERALGKFHISTEVREPDILGPHQRRRVVLKVFKPKKKRQVALGFYQRGSHTLEDIHCCPLVEPAIESFIPSLRLFLSDFLCEQEKMEVAILKAAHGLDVQLIQVARKSLTLDQREALIGFARQQQLLRLRLNQELIVSFQEPVVYFEGVAVEAGAGDFLQASVAVDGLLAKLVHEALHQKAGLKIADLFCGRGTLSLPLLQHGSVDGFEMDEGALKVLKKAISQHQLRLHVHDRNLFRQPLSLQELNSYDVVVLDPPRVGAFAQAKLLEQSAVPSVIYVSCNPQSFARDAAALVRENYTLLYVIPIDQFHWSTHCEVFGLFVHKGQ